MALVGDILSGVLGAANTAYNLYTNKRDFDYQKALQQTMFEREDTAVQRRMADLQAAGLNPNLAAGSAAGAGSVVSRSSTNDVNMGSALDTIAAMNQIKLQRQEQENKNLENKILQSEKSIKANQSAIEHYYTAMNLGFNPRVTPVFDGKGDMHYDFEYPNTNTLPMTKTPLFQLFRNNYEYQMNSNQMLEKQLNWYTANQIADMITGGVGAVTGAVGAAANLKRASSIYKHVR